MDLHRDANAVILAMAYELSRDVLRAAQLVHEAALVAEISSKFANLPPGEVDREIGNAQRRIFEVLDLDVSGFWQWSADASCFFRLTHYSRAGEGAGDS